MPVRTANITVRNNQVLEMFTEPHESGFEFWLVAVIKGQRTVLSHHLTRDDLERRFCYARPADVVWRDASASELPHQKHRSAVEEEKTIARSTFWELHRLADYVSVINVLPNDRKTLDAARKAILGKWTDGVASLSFGPDHRLHWSCALGQPHPLNMGSRTVGQEPDWWSFEAWQLHLMNSERKCGQRIGILHVDDRELHVYSTQPDRLAHVLHRTS